jgi:hypothetical protein
MADEQEQPLSTMSTDTPIDRDTYVQLEEYRVLRDEILSRLESQRQFISLAVIAVGTIFLASAQNPNKTAGAIVILGYPLLSFFFASGWGHNDLRIRQIGEYIKQHIEKNLGILSMPLSEEAGPQGKAGKAKKSGKRKGPLLITDPKRVYLMNWEHTTLGRASDYLATYGIFIGSQIFAIAFGAFLGWDELLKVFQGDLLSQAPPVVAVMLLIGIAPVFPTIFTLRIHSR